MAVPTIVQNRKTSLDKRTSAAVESLLSLRDTIGSPPLYTASEELLPPSLASSVSSSGENATPSSNSLVEHEQGAEYSSGETSFAFQAPTNLLSNFMDCVKTWTPDNMPICKQSLPPGQPGQVVVLTKANQEVISKLIKENSIPIVPVLTRLPRHVAEDNRSKPSHVDKDNRSKPFMCRYPHCGKTYHHSSRLIVHVRTHTGEKPYVCCWEDCERCFAVSDDLVRHRRTHTGEKFECPVCLQKFSRRHHLRVHSQRKHGQSAYLEAAIRKTQAKATSTNHLTQ